ncbi:glycosyltransferase family 2 protein [Motilimonas pumila]|uniref:Glycosyltransferase family 2 protein n=1 Tax=Motilimonas pumila TaxID=2303987 RepID=A0A418YD70_9GAMM|nr:glycosyltransferase family 2 protein [Motilimonas pumila]RJG42464.1 glycosyltransferase family 2 protein [Motilimonas pumila]
MWLILITAACIILVIYHHLGYPLILRWVRQHKRGIAAPHTQHDLPCKPLVESQLPSVVIIVPAYNEATWIADKIRNTAALNYPAEKLTLLIGCDGCDDATYHIAQSTLSEPECQGLQAKVVNFVNNRGKVAVLNQLAKMAQGDLLAFSDTSALLSIDALLITAKHFQTPAVGVLNGSYCLLTQPNYGEQAYWQYQNRIKASEAQLGATLGAHGAFYVIRQALFRPLEADTINDDFILPMRLVADGHQFVYDDNIHAVEQEPSSEQQDHRRRQRIAAGNMQQLLRLKQLCLPRYKGIAFAFLSGKGLRVLMPYLMITALIGSGILAFTHAQFATVFWLQVLAYGIAAVELIFKPKRSPAWVKALGYLVAGHSAGLIGSMRYLLHLDKGHWSK